MKFYLIKSKKKETEINAERQPQTCIRRFNVLRLSALPKLTSRFNSVWIKPRQGFGGACQADSKSYQKKKKKMKAVRKGKALRIAEILLKNKVGVLADCCCCC